MRLRFLLLGFLVLPAAGCHVDRPVVDPTPKASVGGTIAGIVKTADPAIAVVGRKVTVIEVSSGSKFDVTTGANGGYTIQVPQGTYRIEVELRGSEAFVTRPGQTRVNNGDTDSGRDFVITVK